MMPGSGSTDAAWAPVWERVAAHRPGGGGGTAGVAAGFDGVENRAENLLRFGVGRGAGVVAVVLGEDLVAGQQHAVRVERLCGRLAPRRDARRLAASTGWRDSRACAGFRVCRASSTRAIAGCGSCRLDTGPSRWPAPCGADRKTCDRSTVAGRSRSLPERLAPRARWPRRHARPAMLFNWSTIRARTSGECGRGDGDREVVFAG